MFRKLLFTTLMIASSVASASPASKFLSDAIKGDNSETRLGQLIASRGSSAAVRSFGRRLASDHSQAKAQAAALARRMGVAVPSAMMPEARSEYAKLLRLRGRAFDREVRRYMINDHRKDIAKFESQARNGDRRTADLARAQLPTLRTHLRIAESLPG
jgi:putative membrane protein